MDGMLTFACKRKKTTPPLTKQTQDHVGWKKVCKKVCLRLRSEAVGKTNREDQRFTLFTHFL